MPINWSGGGGAAAPPTDEPSGLRRLLAGAVRTGAGWGASIPSMEPGVGSAIGAGIAGLGEGAAEAIEGSKLNPKRIALEAGLGAVPLGLVFTGRPLQSALRSAALSGVGEAGRELSEGQPLNTGRVLGTGAFGAMLGGLLGRVPAEAEAGKVAGPAPTTYEIQQQGGKGTGPLSRSITAPDVPLSYGPPKPPPDPVELNPETEALLRNGGDPILPESRVTPGVAYPSPSTPTGSALKSMLRAQSVEKSDPLAQRKLDLLDKQTQANQAQLDYIRQQREGLDPQKSFTGSLAAKNEMGGTERMGIRWTKPEEEAAAEATQGGGETPSEEAPTAPWDISQPIRTQRSELEDFPELGKSPTIAKGNEVQAEEDVNPQVQPQTRATLARVLGIEPPAAPTAGGLQRGQEFDSMSMFGKGVQIMPDATGAAPEGVLEGTTSLDTIGKKYRQMQAEEPLQGRADQMFRIGQSKIQPLQEKPVARELGKLLRGGAEEAGIPDKSQLDSLTQEYVDAGLTEPAARQAAANKLATPKQTQQEASIPFNTPRGAGLATDNWINEQSELADLMGQDIANKAPLRPVKITPAQERMVRQMGYSSDDMSKMTGEDLQGILKRAKLIPKEPKTRAPKVVENPGAVSGSTPTPAPFNGPQLNLGGLKGGDESGFSNLPFLGHALSSGLGALAGGAVGGQAGHPFLGAALGAAGGALAPTAIKAALSSLGAHPAAIEGLDNFNPVTPEGGIDTGKLKTTAHSVMEALPQVQRFNYLASYSGLPPNIVGSYGAAIMAGIEHTLLGDPRGLALLKQMTPQNYLKEYFAALPEAEQLISHGEAGRDETSMLGGKVGHFLTFPGKTMTAGDVAGRRLLQRAGFSEDEARRITLTSEPESNIGKNTVNYVRNSPLAQMLLPFSRTPMNIGEQGAQRIPGLGFLAQSYRETPDPIRQQVIQQLMGTGVGAGAAAVGSQLDPETAKVVRKYITNLSGQYSLPANIGFAAGQAMEQGKSVPKAMAGGAVGQGLPIPSSESAQQWLTYLLSGGSAPLPRGVLPQDLYDFLGAGKTNP